MKRKINWGFFPEEPIRTYSIVEIIIYILIFGLCIYLFLAWNYISTTHLFISVDNLDKKDLSKDSCVYYDKYCNIYYTFERTKGMHFNDDQTRRLSEGRIENYGEDKYPSIRVYVHKYKPNDPFMPSLANSIMMDLYKNVMQQKTLDDFEFKSIDKALRFFQEVDSSATFDFCDRYAYAMNVKDKTIDSLRNVFFKSTEVNPGKTLFHIYSEDGYSVGVQEKCLKDSTSELNCYMNQGKTIDSYWRESYTAVDTLDSYSYEVRRNRKRSFISYLNLFSYFSRRSLFHKPSYLAIEDISQSYVSFRIDTHTIDSMNVRLDFVGSTEFSSMTPAPDEIGMSYIEFHDPQKIAKIRNDGLFFLAKFKDLEGVQQIRLFGVTAMMSGMLSIFLVFVVLYCFKIRRSLKSLKGDENCQRNAPQDVVDDPSDANKTENEDEQNKDFSESIIVE